MLAPISRRRRLVLVALPALLAGCATRGRVRATEMEIDRLQKQVASLQRENTDLRAQTDSTRNELFILHDRLETARIQLARTQSPPPKLEVVKLVPTPSSDPLAARVATASRPAAPGPTAGRTPAGGPATGASPPPADPLEDEGYDASADEAEMFSIEGDDAAPAPIPMLSAKATSTRAPPAEDAMALYQRAFGIFQQKKWEEAILLFEQFVKAYPTHEYADNAYYWMGECYYTQGEYALAIGEFQRIPEVYPGANKVPDALLKIGISYQALNNRKNAEKTLRQLIDAYPQSSAAGIGRQRLAKMTP